MEKQKQDDALDDLSGVLGQLKGMACDMGSELDRWVNSLIYSEKDRFFFTGEIYIFFKNTKAEALPHFIDKEKIHIDLRKDSH